MPLPTGSSLRDRRRHYAEYILRRRAAGSTMPAPPPCWTDPSATEDELFGTMDRYGELLEAWATGFEEGITRGMPA